MNPDFRLFRLLLLNRWDPDFRLSRLSLSDLPVLLFRLFLLIRWDQLHLKLLLTRRAGGGLLRRLSGGCRSGLTDLLSRLNRLSRWDLLFRLNRLNLMNLW